jgi:hypothetical protein
MDGLALKDFATLLAQGVATPRPVVRRIIAARPDGQARLTLVGLGAALQGALWALCSVFAPAIAVGLGGHAILAVVAFANYAITTSLATQIGRRFGGQGEPTEVAAAVAWHAVVVAALTPLQAAALSGGGPQGEVSGFGVILLLVYAGLNVWLLASCIAEAHRFASTGRVAAVTVGVFVMLGLVLSVLLGSLRG